MGYQEGEMVELLKDINENLITIIGIINTQGKPSTYKDKCWCEREDGRAEVESNDGTVKWEMAFCPVCGKKLT